MTYKYRGTSYQVSAPIRSAPDPVNYPQIKLFYRGCVYDYIPRPALVAEKDWPIVTLFYRGVTYERKLRPLQPYQQPRALNWRWNLTNL